MVTELSDSLKSTKKQSENISQKLKKAFGDYLKKEEVLKKKSFSSETFCPHPVPS